MRGSVRVAALSGLPVIYVWTHDSVGLGEDGPTHQPVEQYAALRAIPNLWFVRPADANETAAAWALALERTAGPTALALTRQKLPVLPGTAEAAREGVRRGGYVIRAASTEAAGGAPDLIHVATGSEVQLAVAAAEALEAEGIATRVVSLPCWEAFEAQDAAYRESVLPAGRQEARGRRDGRLARLGALGRRRGGDRRPRPLRRRRPPRARSWSEFGFTADAVADVGRRVVREGLRGRVAAPPAPHPGTRGGGR